MGAVVQRSRHVPPGLPPTRPVKARSGPVRPLRLTHAAPRPTPCNTQAEHGRSPRPADAADAAALTAAAEQLNGGLAAGSAARLEAVDGAVVGKLAHCAGAEVSPMAALFGGVVGQEVVKAVSGKFHPVFQWLYFDSLESLPEPEQLAAAGPEEYAPLGCRCGRGEGSGQWVGRQGGKMSSSPWPVIRLPHPSLPCITHHVPPPSRYDPQIAVFGRTMQRRLSQLQLFLVRGWGANWGVCMCVCGGGEVS